MVDNVFSVHQIPGGDEASFPFDIKDYQRYVFGDDRLAHRYGTDCAKAFIAHGSGPRAMQQTTPTSHHSAADEFAVAVISGYVPTATCSLRYHFVAYLNRHLVSTKANPALKIDINALVESLHGRAEPQAGSVIYSMDREYARNRIILILNDIRLSQDHEHRVRSSLRQQQISNLVVFVYLATVTHSSVCASLSPILGSIVSPPFKDVEIITHATTFTMNECFVQYILSGDDAEFCKFLRRQDDGFARLLLDYVIEGGYYDNDMCQVNVKILQWEVDTRENL